MTHSPEPWRINDDTDILDADDCMVLGGDCSDYHSPSFEDLDRIVACVNVCAETHVNHLQQLKNHALVLNCIRDIQRKMSAAGLLDQQNPTPESLELFLKLNFGVQTKVEILK